MRPELTILVPIYNEARTVAEIMKEIVNVCPDAQIIYIDDGSQDASLSILKQHARPQDLVLTKENGGKGSAIRLGIAHAEGRYTVIQDADLEYHPMQIPKLLAEAKSHPGSAVFGSRFLTKNPNLYRRYLLGNKVITAFLNICFFTHLTDSYTCYKLFETAALKKFPLRSNGFELEAELSAYPYIFGVPVREIAIHYQPRSLEEGKKIRWYDAYRGMLTMLRIRFLG